MALGLHIFAYIIVYIMWSTFPFEKVQNIQIFGSYSRISVFVDMVYANTQKLFKQ